jgi:hypothetical protein
MGYFNPTFIFAAALVVVTGASVPPCELPLNCGEFNNSKLCGHTFSGCDVCDTCCHSWLKPVGICDGCVEDECTSGRQPDCCVSFECDVPNGQCKRAFSTTGLYPNRSACEEACQVPAVVCTGNSSDLAHADCFNWVSIVRSSAYFAKATPPACQELSHFSDPCSCTGVIGCSGGRITSVILPYRHLAFNASEESSLGLLDGLQHIELYNNALTGPVPKWLLNLTSLNYVWFGGNQLAGTVPVELGALTELTFLDFGYNQQLTGTVPAELGALTGLTGLGFGGNHLTGTVPARLWALTGLTDLTFDHNQLTGTVPAELGALTALTTLAFNHNQLTGTVPAELGALTGLTWLQFQNNQLAGTVPALPFKQYTRQCCLSPNRFSCPLPADAAACICNGRPGVVCS